MSSTCTNIDPKQVPPKCVTTGFTTRCIPDASAQNIAAGMNMTATRQADCGNGTGQYFFQKRS